jgi:hypothetical protein
MYKKENRHFISDWFIGLIGFWHGFCDLFIQKDNFVNL